jgi:hypothetical protein
VEGVVSFWKLYLDSQPLDRRVLRLGRLLRHVLQEELDIAPVTEVAAGQATQEHEQVHQHSTSDLSTVQPFVVGVRGAECTRVRALPVDDHPHPMYKTRSITGGRNR